VRALLLHPAAKPIAFALCLLPLASLVLGAAGNQLGVNPAEALIRSTGDWTLRLLCLTLAITPLRMRTRTPQLARFRRMLGLFTFAYACLHLLAYAWLDMGLEPMQIARDLLKRPFILMGFSTWLLLLLLALTSPRRVVRRLGAELWQSLHQLIYLIAGLALLHFWWMRSGKNDHAEVLAYGAIIAALLLERLLRFLARRQRAARGS